MIFLWLPTCTLCVPIFLECNHPDNYGLCYNEDGGASFEGEGWSCCSKYGYYITGVYRGSGNWLKNIDKFRCCQIAASKEIVSKLLQKITSKIHCL